jgi:hypothetical protein
MRLSALRVYLALATGVAAAATSCRRPVPLTQGTARTCTSAPRSGVAWELGSSPDLVSGRVVGVDGVPLAAAPVRLEPGGQRTATAPEGSFRFAAVPAAGEYRVLVRYIGREEASTVVYLTGRNSLTLLVTLARPAVGLREC